MKFVLEFINDEVKQYDFWHIQGHPERVAKVNKL